MRPGEMLLATALKASVSSKSEAHRYLVLSCRPLANAILFSVVGAPLLLATNGGRRAKLTAMPFATSSSFAPTKKLLEASYRKANSVKSDPDPDLDVEKGKQPKWTTHSLRRGADTVARRDMVATDTKESEIDIFFGWHEKILLKDMQVHYAAMNVRERCKKARITSLM